MSINSSQTTTPIAKIAPTQELRARTQPQERDAAATRSDKRDNTNVTLSELTKKIQTDDSRDVDYARVAELRDALAAGTLRIEPEKIAQAMVQDMFQF
ncbi:flagellar biosynthesis anti-sigma factor FlgM [Enterobacter cloacae]|jgi:negative regulator of flagellin synthesis FlgM|uniref:flagellar biosynthesis anti-sigma factor FlgM n=1 Tax=Enterobacter cloacae complex TaxID=354276 RepID=UPI001A2D8B68|nr:flagellar biosynthesis anti-sigma factor FlgM [Enterobacter cloacae]MCK1077571.1 flagellar biosynthesis anti-sigma factor FlgM [Enterobacter cloacae subsp. cloacae]HAS1733946.1 flagellar biosynthesis anti-sigma factor FlgM [Enterobacter cloacae]HAT7728753.1 flagellar biosynthesis anti-sigma factor FlgM [Enterobacter cloacae]HBL7049294.1 flagellar biosynthesis anti-sigma factor FlgM [Enterobacter cloacae]HCB2121986.1 flagellar biosynthesis anti-sigma factor FlgM [Enterobacter cloacae]